MEKKQLVEKLRERQLKLNLVSENIINSLNDDEIIDSYITCHNCKTKMLEGNDLDISIKVSKDVDDFLDKIEKFSIAIHNHEKKEEEKTFDFKIPNYVTCVSMYYDPKKMNRNYCCRVTIATTDLKSDKIIYQKEYWKEKNNISVDSLSTEVLKEIKKYDGPVIIIEKSIRLERCNCGCNGYKTNFISKKDYIRIISDRKNIINEKHKSN